MNRLLYLIPFVFSCSSALGDIQGCHQELTKAGSDCGDVPKIRVSCELAFLPPENGVGCYAPDGNDLSDTWCCEYIK